MLHNFCRHEVYELCAQAEVKKKISRNKIWWKEKKIEEFKKLLFILIPCGLEAEVGSCFLSDIRLEESMFLFFRFLCA